jgi:hypothetical protein
MMLVIVGVSMEQHWRRCVVGMGSSSQLVTMQVCNLVTDEFSKRLTETAKVSISEENRRRFTMKKAIYSNSKLTTVCSIG